MKYKKFVIKNFKGIENIEINLDKSPNANIYTLVGLNESGKTTILEALNFFTPTGFGINVLEIPGTKIEDYNKLIPISKRDNFNGEVNIRVVVSVDQQDIVKLNEYVINETKFRAIMRKPIKLTI